MEWCFLGQEGRHGRQTLSWRKRRGRDRGSSHIHMKRGKRRRKEEGGRRANFPFPTPSNVGKLAAVATAKGFAKVWGFQVPSNVQEWKLSK